MNRNILHGRIPYTAADVPSEFPPSDTLHSPVRSGAHRALYSDACILASASLVALRGAEEIIEGKLPGRIQLWAPGLAAPPAGEDQILSINQTDTQL